MTDGKHASDEQGTSDGDGAHQVEDDKHTGGSLGGGGDFR